MPGTHRRTPCGCQGQWIRVSRDSDFQERSLVAGHPPQVVWLKIPNRSKTAVLNILIEHRAEIEQALLQKNRACVELSPRGD